MKNSKSQTWRLARSYLLVIMSLSLVFSVIIFAITSSNLNRPLPPESQNSRQIDDDFRREFDNRLSQRDNQTRQSVILSLAILNLLMLGGGTVLSYILARRTLRPIEENMEIQTRFIADASHEIRTPLTVLRMNNELAMRKKQIEPQEITKVLAKNLAEIDRMKNLTDNLLKLSQISSDDFRKSEFNLRDLAGELALAVAPIAKKRQIQIEIDLPENSRVVAFKSPTEQILKILLDNAVKYSDNFGLIKISYRDGFLRVKDFGKGIEEADQKRIFERFYRGDKARTRHQQQSYGLGLSIAKGLSDKCGLELSVESEVGEGAEFKFRV